MRKSGLSISRPTTPETPLTSSLHLATSTMDDLTAALANFSKVPSPEPPSALVCCCGEEECENNKSWLAMKSRLESRLILSAEVGQALLQRHEAYVRQHEARSKLRHQRRDEEDHTGYEQAQKKEKLQEDLDNELEELYKENASLKKRLDQALVNNEVTEVSNKTVIQELQEARSTIARLTAQHARSVGWDSRLSATMKEKDDMQQERDSEAQRAKLAESRFATLKDKTAKLQVEVRRLQQALEEKRTHRLESSESLLQDARSRLEEWQHLIGHRSALDQDGELTKVLESLVNDNETLKRDNAEMQRFLAEAREELHSLQEEVEEQRAHPPSHLTVRIPSQSLNPSVHSFALEEPLPQNMKQRSKSTERNPRRTFEPLTPETNRRPLSPADSTTPSDARDLSSQEQKSYTASHISIDIENDTDSGGRGPTPEQLRLHDTAPSLTRSRGVQTDSLRTAGHLASPFRVHLSTPSSKDPYSESSSFSESPPSNFTMILERATALLGRMTQADALTLANRLKRQNIKGGDLGHLSRSTVNSITAEVSALRMQFRALLEDDKIITTCTRKDLRILFKFLRDIFAEIGQLRVTLNDVILDPSTATKISELALDPSKAESEKRRKDSGKGSSPTFGTPAWMAPISKLFGAGRGDSNPLEQSVPSRLVGSRGPPQPSRFIPKIGPALAASATTVNVEFSGVGRSTTSTSSPQASRAHLNTKLQPTPPTTSAGVMDIFAGAPRVAPTDPWVVVSKAKQTTQSFFETGGPSDHSTLGRSFARGMNPTVARLSRNVDAVIDVASPVVADDDEEYDAVTPLTGRTLRRRGLSDSSIHTTLTSHAEGAYTTDSPAPMSPVERLPARDAWPDRGSVLESLSRTVQNFRLTASGALAGTGSEAATTLPRPQNIPPSQPRGGPRPRETSYSGQTSSPGFSNFIPHLSSWAAAGVMLDSDSAAAPDPFVIGSVRDETFVQRRRRPGESYSRDYL